MFDKRSHSVREDDRREKEGAEGGRCHWCGDLQRGARRCGDCLRAACGLCVGEGGLCVVCGCLRASKAAPPQETTALAADRSLMHQLRRLDSLASDRRVLADIGGVLADLDGLCVDRLPEAVEAARRNLAATMADLDRLACMVEVAVDGDNREDAEMVLLPLLRAVVKAGLLRRVGLAEEVDGSPQSLAEGERGTAGFQIDEGEDADAPPPSPTPANIVVDESLIGNIAAIDRSTAIDPIDVDECNEGSMAADDGDRVQDEINELKRSITGIEIGEAQAREDSRPARASSRLRARRARGDPEWLPAEDGARPIKEERVAPPSVPMATASAKAAPAPKPHPCVVPPFPSMVTVTKHNSHLLLPSPSMATVTKHNPHLVTPCPTMTTVPKPDPHIAMTTVTKTGTHLVTPSPSMATVTKHNPHLVAPAACPPERSFVIRAAEVETVAAVDPASLAQKRWSWNHSGVCKVIIPLRTRTSDSPESAAAPASRKRLAEHNHGDVKGDAVDRDSSRKRGRPRKYFSNFVLDFGGQSTTDEM